MNIYGNEKANIAARNAIELEPNPTLIGLSISFLFRKLKEKTLSEWQDIWDTSKKSTYYMQFQTKLQYA
jgi:hypothetical protein